MLEAIPDRVRFQTVLQAGTAIAVLIHDAPAETVDRDALASASLQQVTGRSDILIGRRPSARPCLAPPHCKLGVSMSKRGPVLLAGYSSDAPIGVDLEIDDGTSSLDPVRLARDHFACDEADAVAAVPASDARDLFLKLWVAKEAALKATGRGIVDGLHHPNLATQVVALRSAPAVIEIPSQHGITFAITRITLVADRSAYCALAVLGPPRRPEAI